MKSELEVFHGSNRLGHLVEEATGNWAFIYSPEFLAERPAGVTVSLRLPPRDDPYGGDDVVSLFRNLLPDGDIRRQLARKIGVSEGNDFRLLGAICGDCVGALRLAAPGELATQESELRLLNEHDLRNVVAALPLHPLLIDVEGVRLSLPGEQHKIPVRYDGERISLTFGNALSSHIAKPAKAGLRESVMNEGFCLQLAATLGLETAKSIIRHGAVTLLVVDRLDRVQRDGQWQPVHMEDFAQLMAARPEQQYQREGGLGVADCITCIKQYSVMPAADMRSLLRWLVFSFLIGNGGGHAKQLAMRHLAEGPRLAPFYGLMSTHVYPALNSRLAMSIGNEDRPDWIIPARWRELAAAIDVRGAYVLEILRDFAERAPHAAAQVADQFQRQNGFASVVRDIRSLVERRARQTLVSLEAERI
ncbi:MAG: serine/threonine-protein kinase HipA [Gammaproteobacteria bacterium]|jgi:serine/threonine-protein kinase HipA